jgi:hypothetical protein
LRASKRQLIWLFAVFFLMVTTASAAWAEGESEEVMETPLDLDELVRPSVVYAEITVETPAYDDWATGRSKVGQFSAGEVVEVVRKKADHQRQGAKGSGEHRKKISFPGQLGTKLLGLNARADGKNSRSTSDIKGNKS